MKWLGFPAVTDQHVSQVVEQFMLDRLSCSESKITRIFDQGFSEMVHPDPVDPDSCGERIILAGDGVCQVEAAAPVSERSLWDGRSNLQKLSGYRGSSLGWVTALKNDRINERIVINHDHRPWCRGLVFDRDAVDLVDQPAESILVLAGEVVGGFVDREPDRTLPGEK